MRVWFAVALLLGACSSHDEPTAALDCPADYTQAGGACVARIDACADGELPRIGGGCTPVGARTCGEGFTLAKTSGCSPVLPAAACPKGQMAIPGETVCHSVSPCGTGPWGDIPVGADTLYVDAAYTGADADGSAAHPFPTIQRGVDAAKPKAVVAVAAGRYPEDLVIRSSVRLFGVCPDKVEVAGVSKTFAIDVSSDAELHALAVTGPSVGIGVYAARVLVDRVWVHDAGEWGVDVEDSVTRAGELVLTNSLVEGSGLIGAFATGSVLRIDRSVVRDTKASKKGAATDGVLARATPDTRRASNLFVTRSVVAGNATYGVLVNASSGVVEDSYVTETRGLGGDPAGGLNAHDLESGVPEPHTSLTVRRSVVDKAAGVGIDVFHTDVRLEDVTVRSIDGYRPGGVLIEGSSGSIAGLTIEDTVGTGLAIGRSKVVSGRVQASRVLVRNIGLMSDGTSGVGIFVQGPPGIDSRFELSESVVDNTHSVGIAITANAAKISDSFVGRVKPDAHGHFGDGITAVSGLAADGALELATLEITRTLARGAARVALASFGAATKTSGSVFCAPSDMQLVNWYAIDADTEVESPASIADLGANSCGCDAPHPCRAEVGALEPVHSPW